MLNNGIMHLQNLAKMDFWAGEGGSPRGLYIALRRREGSVGINRTSLPAKGGSDALTARERLREMLLAWPSPGTAEWDRVP